jgi:hypothetical protein
MIVISIGANAMRNSHLQRWYKIDSRLNLEPSHG